MNKVALQLFLQGKEIEIYFYETEEYKDVERELLQRINTKYNQKNNEWPYVNIWYKKMSFFLS